MIRQVVYLSAARGTIGDADLDGILNEARAGNGPRGITGLLAFGGGLFLQILEGPRDTIEAALIHLRRDPRHQALRILQDEMAEARDFAGWPMAFRALDPDAARLISARTRAAPMAVRDVAAVLGDAAAAAGVRLELAA